jgi:hypothetical protein
MSVNRVLSLVAALVLVVFAVIHSFSFWEFAVLSSIALVLIWVPAEVNEYTLGLWYAGYRIENPTPAWMISTGGWLLLGGIAWLLFRF